MEVAFVSDYSEQRLSQFAKEQWDKSLPYLQKTFGLSRVDCEDIFQESFITLYRQIVDGKLVNLKSSLSTYFIAICRNKAFEYLRTKGSEVSIEDEFKIISTDDESETLRDEMFERVLSLEEESSAIEFRKRALVREIVRDLPSPCNELLWGFYRDGFSMKTLAQMFNYKSEDAVKVTKHRCCSKFRSRFEERLKYLY